MAKNKVSEWSPTPSNNTDISGINIAEGCAPSGINNAIRELMAQVKDMQAGTDGDNFVVGGAFTCTGAAVFSSTVALGASATATTQSANDNSTKVATTAYVANNAIPSGGIIIWSGSSASIPSGWYLCNGSNSTPDLRDRFVVGAGSTYAVGNTGGSKDAITVSHTHSVTDPGHAHKLLSSGRGMISGGSNTAFFDTYKTTSTLTFQNLTSGNAETNAGSESNTTGISIQSTGDSGTDANLPPYYALCYIMKA
jgi:microcystin-dependent protein